MAESSVNNIDGIPFWGHGSEENLLAGITPIYGQETSEEVVEEDAPTDDGDEEETETEPSSE